MGSCLSYVTLGLICMITVVPRRYALLNPSMEGIFTYWLCRQTLPSAEQQYYRASRDATLQDPSLVTIGDMSLLHRERTLPCRNGPQPTSCWSTVFLLHVIMCYNRSNADWRLVAMATLIATTEALLQSLCFTTEESDQDDAPLRPLALP